MNEANHNQNARERFEEQLRKMPLAGEGNGFNDQALPKAARLAKVAGLTQDEAVEAILRTQAGAPRDPEQEVRCTVERIYEDDGEQRETKKPKWPERDPRLVSEVVSEAGGLKELGEASPVQDLDRPTIQFLEPLFDGDPLITLGEKAVDQGGKVTIPGFTMLVSKFKELQTDRFEYIVPSPAIKKEGRRVDGEPSKHSKDMYPVRLFLVIEFDGTPKEQAATILLHLAQFAPLVMVVDSGGKSLHGWFFCLGVPEPDVHRFFTYAVRLGADSKMYETHQFARLPNGIRSGSRKKQQVLYWDADAKGRPWKLDGIRGGISVCSLLEIPVDEDDEESNLIGDRFVCRGKAGQLVGPTGIGKSTLIVQAIIQWAIGQGLFGITASRPLRIIYIQAENDDQDVATMVRGVMRGLQISVEARRLIAQNVFYCRLNDYGKDILEQIDGIVDRLKIDLVILDPLFAYLPGGISEQEKVSHFLRRKLQPFLERHNCGAIILHHIPKPPSSKKDKPEWSGGDFAYAGFGSAELANFFKAILVIRNIGSQDVFELIVAKRHKKAGLRDKDGALTNKVLIKHSSDDLQYWELASEEDAMNEESSRFAELGDAFVKVARGTSGTVTMKDLAQEMGMNKRSLDRMFQGKDCLYASACGGAKRLVLSRKRGKIQGYERGPNGEVRYKVRQDMGDRDTGHGASTNAQTAEQQERTE